MRLMVIAQSITIGTVQGGQPIISLNYLKPTAQALVLDLLPAAKPGAFVLTTELTAHSAAAQLRVIGVVHSSRHLKLSTPMVMMGRMTPVPPRKDTFEYLIAGRTPVNHRILNAIYQYLRLGGSVLLRCGIHDIAFPGKTATIDNWEAELDTILSRDEFREYCKTHFAA